MSTSVPEHLWYIYLYFLLKLTTCLMKCVNIYDCFHRLSQNFWTGYISVPRSVMMDAAAPSKLEVGLTSHTARQHGERQVSCWCDTLWASGRKKRPHGGGVRFQNPENTLDLFSCFHQLMLKTAESFENNFADLDSSGCWRFDSSTGSVQLYLKTI